MLHSIRISRTERFKFLWETKMQLLFHISYKKKEITISYKFKRKYNINKHVFIKLPFNISNNGVISNLILLKSRYRTQKNGIPKLINAVTNIIILLMHDYALLLIIYNNTDRNIISMDIIHQICIPIISLVK